MAYSGRFKPVHPEKYDGDPTRIQWRSSWELKLQRWLDGNKDVISWSSEEVIIPYRSPVDGKMHRYFPDFVVKVKQASGEIKTIMIEVKPYGQTIVPSREGMKTKTGRISPKYRKAVETYAINEAKWTAARAACAARGWEFTVMTEYDLGIAKRRSS